MTPYSISDTIKAEFESHLKAIEDTIEKLQPSTVEGAMMMVETLRTGNKILLCGNGGSAADAQHIAAELTGRYKAERRGLPAIALTTDTSALTAIGNDYGYERVFDRQLEALAREGDLLVGISTSGNSENVIRALGLARELGCRTLGFSGRDGGAMNGLCDLNIVVPSDNTPRIQEMHILIAHTMCQVIDDMI